MAGRYIDFYACFIAVRWSGSVELLSSDLVFDNYDAVTKQSWVQVLAVY